MAIWMNLARARQLDTSKLEWELCPSPPISRAFGPMGSLYVIDHISHNSVTVEVTDSWMDAAYAAIDELTAKIAYEAADNLTVRPAHETNPSVDELA